MPTTIRTKHRAETPNPTPTTILCLPFLWSEQCLESGRKKKHESYYGYPKNKQ
jgi:hypothetical protein